MNLTNEQIQAILDGAPEGATHIDIEGDYWVMQETQAQFWCDKFEWSYAEPQEPLHSLSDLREILTLRQEVERLKVEVESKNHDKIEAVKKARTQWAREDVASIKKRESEVAARAVEEEWIECTKKLPEQGGWYMVAIYDPFDLGYITEFGLMAHFSGGKSETWSECDPIDDGCVVTHWMPLIKGPYANQLRKGECDE